MAEHWSRKLCLFPVTPGAWNTVTHILFAQKVKVAHLRPGPILCDHMDYTVHGILQARILEWVAFPFSRGIFPTQGLNPGLLHCRQILYQLSHQGIQVPLLRGGRYFSTWQTGKRGWGQKAGHSPWQIVLRGPTLYFPKVASDTPMLIPT